MAAPTYTRNQTSLDALTAGSTAASLNGASAYGSLSGSLLGGNGTGTHLGARRAFSTNIDATGDKYIGISWAEYDSYRWMEDNGPTWASGGAYRLYFVDGSGNWSGWKFVSSDMTDSPDQGALAPRYASPGNQDTPILVIDRGATADFSSGTLDWSDLDAVEVHTLRTGSGSMGVEVFELSSWDATVVTAGEVADPGEFAGLLAVFGTYDDDGTDHSVRSAYRRSSKFNQGLQESVLLIWDLNIGDGSTVTRFESSSEACAWAPSDVAYDTEADQRDLPCSFIGDGATNRRIQVDQTSTCYCSFTRGSMTACPDAAGDADFIVTGSASGTVTIDEYAFNYLDVVELAHADCTSVIFDGVNVIEVNGDTTMAGCVIRNTAAAAKGLYIQTAPADYGALDVTFKDSNAGDDITINPSSAGTFTLDGITVDSGHTLAIRNESATHAITVEVPAGTATSTSTAGGTVTVSAPPVDVTVTCVDRDGAAIQNARVLVEESPGGTDVLTGLTNASGVLTGTYSGSVPQAVTGTARKASASPYYKEAPISGTITSAGFEVTLTMTLDE